MRAMGWLTLVGLVLLAIFAAANWSVLSVPASLNLLVVTVQGPPGLVLLAATLLFVALFIVYAVSLRTVALVETRRHMRELQTQRELADNAEASRFNALGTHLDEELATLRATLEQSRTEILARSEKLEAKIVGALNETANSLSACVGEVDDKLDRMSPRP